jgi:hypothetical protein
MESYLEYGYPYRYRRLGIIKNSMPHTAYSTCMCPIASVRLIRFPPLSALNYFTVEGAEIKPGKHVC